MIRNLFSTTKLSNMMTMYMLTSNPAAINAAAELIMMGEVIAVPTDTVYGVCCNANNSEAVNKLFNIKGRNFNKPVSLCFSSVGDIEKWTDVSFIPKNVINKLLPGPVTLVLRAKATLYSLISTKSTVSNKLVFGARIPQNQFIQSICESLDYPVALTSANVSGQNDTINVNEFKELWPHLAGVFDHGSLEYRAPSTVVDLSEPFKYKIVREGAGLDFVKKVLFDFHYDSIV